MQSLYQKYRPSNFSQVVGQEKIVQTLQNALKSGRVGHAYLFAGQRGTGKTTFARILAKAVNCDKSKDGEACGKCEQCKTIESGQSVDIIEIDAASNRGIDEIRELRDKIKFAPTASKYKVYIIDEVHMLTKEAFNALLKTLEEPPAHVIFILATTEAHKLPATILSRVQRFDFGRIKPSDLMKNLRHIVDEEKIDIDDAALSLIAAKADGSHRDSISILEQIKSYASKISTQEVEEVLGLANREFVAKLAKLIVSGDRKGALCSAEEYYQTGYDLVELSVALAEAFKAAILYASGAKELLLEWQAEDEFLQSAAKSELTQLLAVCELFLEGAKLIKNAPSPLIPLELAISKSISRLCGDIAQVKTENINSKSQETNSKQIPNSKILNNKPKAEIQAESGADSRGVGPDSLGVDAETANAATTVLTIESATESPTVLTTESPIEPTTESPSATIPLDEESWKTILDKIKTENASLNALLRDIRPLGKDEGKLVLCAKFKFHKEKISEIKNRDLIEKIIEEVLGERLSIFCELSDKLPAQSKTLSDDELLKTAEEVFS